ncbi:ribonuclease domain-containing protein [Kribbella sp. CA-293567]|uniref:ribonuclease domain-containing protein n=1 Tax=Kribbella sp. CA-293567 TaxID=3002436 RepID=UPI0022DDBA2B|nr:ribonuclease domain-containing protein [Kribbella sp. CA-293567]WBQ02618.1 ribonuclease N1 [Kribbella sp. CA-293567]
MMNNPKVVRAVAVVVIALMVITLAASLIGCSPSGTATQDRPTKDPVSGLPYVAVADLPKEGQQTLELIDKGGPYPYGKDGATFGNFEKILPKQNRGYYREFTVKTPGERDRGARRIVTGQGDERYYTDDHYKSFRRIQADGGTGG